MTIMRILSSILLLFLLWLAVPTPANASFCRTIEGKEICLVSIKRSAKNFWEYRASVKINGKISPMAVYNCRTRTKTKADGTRDKFEKNGAGKLICQFLSK